MRAGRACACVCAACVPWCAADRTAPWRARSIPSNVPCVNKERVGAELHAHAPMQSPKSFHLTVPYIFRILSPQLLTDSRLLRDTGFGPTRHTAPGHTLIIGPMSDADTRRRPTGARSLA